MIDSTVPEVDDIFGPPDEVDHARALQSGIEYYEKLMTYSVSPGATTCSRSSISTAKAWVSACAGSRTKLSMQSLKETAPSITGPDGDAQ